MRNSWYGMMTALLLGAACTVNAANGDLLIDGKLNGTSTGGDSGLAADGKTPAINWTKADKKTALTIVPQLHDWSAYDTLTFRVYSPRAGQDAFMLTLSSNPADYKGKDNYYSMKVMVDWTGWKEFEIPFKKLDVTRSPVGWQKIDTVVFNSFGWGLEPKPGMTLSIASIRLLSKTPQKTVKPANNNARLIPVNPAESLMSAFWDPNLSDFSAWKFEVCAGGEVKQTWASVDFAWKSGGQEPKVTLIRDMDLDCSAFDRLIAAVALSPGIKFDMTAVTDVGERKMTVVVPEKSKITEYNLDLNGAKKITRLIMAFSADKPGSGLFKWVGFHSTADYKVWDAYWNKIRQMDFSPYLNAEAKGDFNPTLQLFCGQKELDAVRSRLTEQPQEIETFKAWRNKIMLQPTAENRLREYATGDPRFVRDRDAASGSLADSAGPAWIGAVLKDQEMMQLAAKRAIALALCPKWGAGMLSSIPGTTWEHRCFDESMMVLDLMFTLDLAGEYISPMGRDLIMRSVAERGQGTINFNVWKYGYIFDCNQLAAFSPGRIAAYGAMEKLNWPHVTDYTDLAMKELNDCMRRNFRPDGGFVEGPDYYQYTLWGAMPAYYVYARLRKKEFNAILPKELQNSPTFAELLVSTDEKQYFIPLNDGSHGLNLDSICFMAAMFPESQFVRLFNRLLKKQSLPAGSRWAWMVGANIPKNDPPYRPFVQIASMASASSVREFDGQITKTALLGDAVGNTHKHDDVGAFIIELAGETLAMDSSGCFYNLPIHKVLAQADRHNVMVPQGELKGQKRLKEALPFKASGDKQSFHAELDLQPCWADWFNVRKRILDSPEPKTIVIRDIFELKKGDGVAFYWLTPQKVEVKGSEVTITGTRAVAKFVVPEGWEVKTETLDRQVHAPQQRLTLSSKLKRGELVLTITLSLLPQPATAKL